MHIKFSVLIISVFIFGLVTSVGLGDTITLKSGLIFNGKSIETTKDEVKLETFKGEVTIPIKLIGKHDKSKSPHELYLAEKEKLLKDKEEDAEANYKLGLWCKKNKIWHKAKLHLAKALEIDKDTPDETRYKNTKKALEEVEKEWEEQCKKSRYGFTLNIGVAVNLSKEEIEKLVPVINQCSQELARSTGGMLYFKEVIFTNNTRAGNMLYNPNGATAGSGLAAVPGGHNNYEHGPKNWHPVCILHEFGHFTLRLADEYDTSIYGGPKVPPERVCPKCKMTFPQKQPGSDWCSSLYHPKGAGNTPGCQEILITKYKKDCPLLCEAFNYAPEEILYPPEPKITINDQPKK